MNDYENKRVQKMMDSLAELGVLEKTEDERYSVSFDFDLTFRGLLGHLLKRMKDPLKVEETINRAFVEALYNYGFCEMHKRDDIQLAVGIIRTFEKEDKVEQIMKAVGL